jgi:hypothetical protein
MIRGHSGPRWGVDWYTEAPNTPVQGSDADEVKRALV